MFHAPIVQWLSTCSCSVSNDMSLFFLSHKGVVHGTKGSKIWTSTMNSFTPQGALSTNHCAHASKTWLRVGSQQGDMSCGDVNIYHARILRNASLASINERSQHIWLLCLWWLWWPDADTNKCSEFSGCMTVFLNDSVVILGQQWHDWRLWMVAVQREFVQSSNGRQIQSGIEIRWSQCDRLLKHRTKSCLQWRNSHLTLWWRSWRWQKTDLEKQEVHFVQCSQYIFVPNMGLGFFFFFLCSARFKQARPKISTWTRPSKHATTLKLQWGRRQVSSTKQYLSSTYLYGVPPNIRRAVNSNKKKGMQYKIRVQV